MEMEGEAFVEIEEETIVDIENETVVVIEEATVVVIEEATTKAPNVITKIFLDNILKEIFTEIT